MAALKNDEMEKLQSERDLLIAFAKEMEVWARYNDRGVRMKCLKVLDAMGVSIE